MADIRINALANTASSTASDDYLAVDGTTNGTRKLSAYSPTFGGNLTVSGAATVKGQISSVTNSTIIVDYVTGSDYGRLLSPNSSGAYTTAIQIVNPLTVAGNLTVSGTGTSTFAGRIQTTSANGIEAIVGSGNTGFAIQSGTTQYSLYLNAADNSFRIYSSLGGDRLTVSSGGNFLIGTTIDGGQLLQVNGTAYVSGNATFAGGIWSTGYTNIPNDSTSRAILGVTGGVAYLQSLTGQTNNALSIDGSSITLRSGSYATALTLDSSQNATFAGTVKPQLAATASAPTYVKGAIYFDTTLNKLRVGGATGWETITSV